ncbi:ankyrin repeat-containing domain protein [Ilyonectria destructans]|nr:ankyrin repeat-containing domain protein [Ilyonectria destructans]
MAKDWEFFRDVIRHLYHVEGKTLIEVMRLMKDTHNFIASQRSYRSQLRKWGFMKYNTKNHPKPNPNLKLLPKSIRNTRNLLPSSPPHHQAAPKPAPLPYSQGEPRTTTQENSHKNTFLATVTNRSPEPSSPEIIDLSETSGPPSVDLAQDAQDDEGRTQLHRAVMTEDLEKVRQLLATGSSPNMEDRLGNMPIHYSVIIGNAGLVHEFIRFGADVNGQGLRGRSPLHLAVASASRFVNLLINFGAIVNRQDDNGDIPLHLAISAALMDGSPFPGSTSESLINAGSNLNHANKAGVTPFLKLLDQKYSGRYVLSAIDAALRMGGSVTKYLPDGRTPLQIFLSRSETRGLYGDSRARGDQEAAGMILKVFLDKGASVTTPTPSGESLVMHYLKNVYLDTDTDADPDSTLAEMLCKGSSLNAVDRNGNSVLHLLAIKCSSRKREKGSSVEDLIQMQLENGANPNHSNHDGQTPLILLFTTPKNDPSVILRVMLSLLARGADPWHRNSSGKFALLEAEKRFRLDTHNVLRAILDADLQYRDAQVRYRGAAPDRVCWQGWKKAAQSKEWSESKQQLLFQFGRPSPEVSDAVREAAFAVLAEKHIGLAKDKFERDTTETDSHRRHVAGIVHDCRARNIAIDMKCFDYLLELCL